MNLAVFFLLAQVVSSFVLPSKSLDRTSNNHLTQLELFNLFNEGKKALVKKLAGDYDTEVIRARVDGLINENDVLMLSFRT
mmetsp:Transcript_10889/g.16746  ORF Transcript_10889/g.16746 Transcript_10889/m.16746 type:complete len:81 (-) Transcript_10889:1554-1796(-)